MDAGENKKGKPPVTVYPSFIFVVAQSCYVIIMVWESGEDVSNPLIFLGPAHMIPRAWLNKLRLNNLGRDGKGLY